MKLREREGKGSIEEGRSKVIYGWWMVDILSLELYIKVGKANTTELQPKVRKTCIILNCKRSDE